MSVTVPGWADTLLDIIGVAWPNVDEDAYRDMADALREFAGDLEDDGQLANNHFERLLSSGQGESLDALNEHWQKVKGKHVKDIAGAARTIAGALDTAATAITTMKGLAMGQLAWLAGEAGISLALIPVTGGLSMLLGGTAIRLTQEAVKRLIKECAEEVVGYIVSAMAEPAVAALEGMAADLVVQLGAVAIGLQDGVDLDQTKDAGKEGFKDGVQSGKDAMHLASAGGGGKGPGSGLKNLHIEHDEHTHASTQLNAVSAGIHGKTAGKLAKAKTAHGRARGKDSIADAIDPVADKALEALTKAAKTMGDHVGQTLPKVVKQISVDHKNTDDNLRDRFARQRKGDPDRGSGRDGGGPRRDGRGDSGRKPPQALNSAKDDPRRHAIPETKKRCENDPVDVATGEMILTHTDLSLPGVLPLVLRRTHLSGYRFGHWYGHSWASTLDERVELDLASSPGAVWARQDGSLLVYPGLPQDDGSLVAPLEGPRLGLSWYSQHEDETTYRVTDPRSGLTRFFTGSPYRASTAYWLTGIEDRNNNRITISRRPDGAPTVVAHSGGYTARVTTEAGRAAALHLHTPDGLVEIRRYGYDDAGLLTEIFNDSGVPLRLAYDSEGRITSWTDRNGSAFRYLYDAAGRVKATVGPDGVLSSSFAYDTHPEIGHSLTRYTDSTGATTLFQMNEALQVVTETDALGHTSRFSFDARDELLTQTDATGRTTCFERNDYGDLVAVTAADGVRTTAAYNGLHQPVEVTERGGATNRYTYDERGNALTAVDADGATTHCTYDEHGHLTGVVNAAGGRTTIGTDRAGLPVQITTPDGATAVFTRDAFGRIITATDALGGTLKQGWTAEGRPAWRELPDGTREQWTWDPEGNLTTHTDRMGRTTTHTATHFDLRSGTRTADGADHRFTHDTELRLAKVTNAQGSEWHYTYDAAGRLIAETDFDGRTLTYERDPLGRVTRRTNAAGQSLTYERDPLGRVIRLAHDDGTAASFTYDASGYLIRATNQHADITFARDAAGRTVSETVNGRTLTHAYDAMGRPAYRRTPSGAASLIDYTADGIARYQAGDHTFHFTRDALGRETSRTLGSLTLRHAWDPVGRITSQTAAHNLSTVLDRTATYQADGTPTQLHDSRTGTRTYTLDPASRITAVDADGWREQYAYNTTGDLAHSALPPHAPGHEDAGRHTYTGSRLTHAGRTTFTYDAQGRITQRQTRTLSGKILTWHYTWNAEDRLTCVTTPTGDHWDYHYDAFGRRIAKQQTTADGRTTALVTYTWDGGQIAEQYDGTTTLTWDYLGLQPLAQREARGATQDDTDRRFFAIIADLTGSPSDLLTPDGDTAWHARTTAWGITQWNRDATAYTPLRQPGQYFDPETGHHYNVNRYYDPHHGRYLTPDPLGLAPAINHYAYVPNPFTLSDPLGLAGCSADPTWGGRVTFTRDAHGRPYEMNAIISRDMLDEGTDANGNLRPPGFLGGIYNQARGHMLANRLGGSGDTLDNLFTITQNPTNSPDMRHWEDQVYRAVAAGKIVTYNVYLDYTDDLPDSVPKYIQLEAHDQHGNLIFDQPLTNPAHGQQQRHRLGLLP
ncbi:RHS repeat-associated core domain-containing protein [Streptomyces sp. NPDC048659]|uniref:RHS repeat-associated core domain-containing protein n=1 Tax=Streptomyces sp. NPDC048659 TaxID=3155489 RepID=UPI00343ACDB7